MKKNVLLISVVILAILPLFIQKGADFCGQTEKLKRPSVKSIQAIVPYDA